MKEDASHMADKQQGAIDTKGLKQERIPVTRSGEGHDLSFDIDGLPDEIYVGDIVSLVLFAQCSSGCSLVGDKVEVCEVATGKQVAQAEFSEEEDGLSYTEGMLLTMPPTPGDYQYKIRYTPAPLPPPEDGGPAFPNPHPVKELLLVITVKEHHVALSTWGLTSPVWVGEKLEVCVGASCTDSCDLSGSTIQVFDADGTMVAEGTLQKPAEPRPQLYWTSLTATAPMEAKLQRWEARFVSAERLDIPHEAAAHKFSFVGRVRPERNLVVHVIDEKVGKPQRSARVEIKPEGGKAQFASTNAEGVATIGCAKDVYDMKITAASRKTFTAKVDLSENDVEVEVHLLPTTGTEEPVPLKYLAGGPAPKPAEAEGPAAAPEQAAPAKPEEPPAEAAEPVAEPAAPAEAAEPAAAPEAPADADKPQG